MLGSNVMWGQPEIKLLRNALQPPNVANAALEQTMLTAALVYKKAIMNSEVVRPSILVVLY